jgi:hypothetical protein
VASSQLNEISAQKLKPEEFVSKHLEALGTAETRDSVKSFANLQQIFTITKKGVADHKATPIWADSNFLRSYKDISKITHSILSAVGSSPLASLRRAHLAPI